MRLESWLADTDPLLSKWANSIRAYEALLSVSPGQTVKQRKRRVKMKIKVEILRASYARRRAMILWREKYSGQN